MIYFSLFYSKALLYVCKDKTEIIVFTFRLTRVNDKMINNHDDNRNVGKHF